MTELFPLSVFPLSLASSVVTTVWMGVFVVAFFNLRFGWVFSGLVVPGYVVPLLLVKPWAALVILMEGAVTYLLVWMYSERLSRWGFWSGLFGRDRFFAIVLVSVGVRLLMDGWLLPELGRWINETWQLDFDYQHHLHSFGLVIVALVANALWKPGILRGGMSLGVMIAITFVLVRFVLMELTNFSVGNLAYLYEEIATSMLASPKAYIILIITSFLASRMNLVYGWDFSGILIPSLLALEWYQPQKILASFCEAFVILALATLALRLPIFRSMTVEGARKTLLFFNVSFVYKLSLGYGFEWFAPEVKVSDYFGFGYLLPTLLAVKMHDKAIYARLPSATLQTSLAAVALASMIGFSLTFLPELANRGLNLQFSSSAGLSTRGWFSIPATGPAAALREKIHLYASFEHPRFLAPSAYELQLFEDAARDLQQFLRTGQPAPRERAKVQFARIGYDLGELPDGYVTVKETDPRRGWGFYLFNSKSPDGLVVETPGSMDEAWAFEAALEIGRRLGASAWAFSGASRRAAFESESDCLRSRRLFFHRFHRVFAGERALQVRSIQSNPKAATNQPVLWIKRAIPHGLNLRALEELTGVLRIEWREPNEENLQRLASYSGFAQLDLPEATAKHLATRAYTSVPAKSGADSNNVATVIAEVGTSVIPPNANTFRPPSLASLIYFDRQFLALLFRTLAQPGGLSDSDEQLLAGVLATFDGSWQLFRNEKLLWIDLQQAGGGAGGGWLLLNLEPSARVLVQVPYPVREAGTVEFAQELQRSLTSAALVIAGAHPEANSDGSANVLRLLNKRTFFTLASQIYFRECQSEPAIALAVRGLSAAAAAVAQTDAVIARSIVGRSDATSHTIQQLIQLLDKRGLTHHFFDGPPPFFSAEPDNTPTGFYLSESGSKEMVSLWITPAIRHSYALRSSATENDPALDALGILTLTEEAEPLLLQTFTTEAVTYQGELEALLINYLQSRNVVALHAAQRRWPEITLTKLLDPSTRRQFLLARIQERCVLALNLNAVRKEQIIRAHRDIRTAVQDFLEQNAAALSTGGLQ